MHVYGWRGDGAGEDEEKNSGQNEHECVGRWGEMLFLRLGLG